MVLTAALAAPVRAAPKRKVTVETKPAGATVYLESKENGPVCEATPCTFEAPVGDTPMIVELENHVSLIESLSVPNKRDRTPIKVKLQLEPAIGKIVVTGPKGVRITINDEDKGKAPAEIEMPAGAYIVVLSMNGKQLESLPVEVVAGEDVEVTGGGSEVADTGGGDEIDDGPPPDDKRVTKSAARPRRDFIAVLALVDVVFRDFTYDNVETTNTLSPAFEIGNLIGPGVELYPGRLAGVSALKGLSLFARFQVNFGAQPVTGDGIAGTTVPAWRSLEASIRQRFTFGSATLEGSAGYVSDRYGYDTDTMADKRLVPDVEYSAIRLGGRGSLLLGMIEPFVGGDYRIVTSGGPLESRWNDTAATGLRIGAGLNAKLGPFDARAEGSLTLYRWAFAPMPSGEFVATGGADSIKQINLALRYAY